MLDFTSTIPMVDTDPYLEGVPVPPPAHTGVVELLRFLRLAFEPNEHVQLCIEANAEGQPGYNRPSGSTQAELIETLKTSQSIADLAGDIGPHGAWIGFNPVDGSGTREANVTAFRHALLQADEGEIEDQLAVIQKLNIPCACIIHSGNKSLHAIVRVDATSTREYRDRVDMLYATARRGGLKVDGKHRGASRLCRMPGALRGDQPQYIVAAQKKAVLKGRDVSITERERNVELQEASFADREKRIVDRYQTLLRAITETNLKNDKRNSG